MEKTECFKFQQLDAYKVAREIAVRVHEASVCELAGAIDLSAAIGAMSSAEAEAIIALLLRLKRMLRALTGTSR